MIRIDAWLVAAALAVSAPIAVVQAAPVVDRSMIVQVAGGCGEGWHRGPNGGCRKNYREDQKAKHPCPRGYYLSPRTGRCRANGT